MARIIPEEEEEEEETEETRVEESAERTSSEDISANSVSSPASAQQWPGGARPRITNTGNAVAQNLPPRLKDVPSQYRESANEGAHIYLNIVDEEIQTQGLRDRLRVEGRGGGDADVAVNTCDMPWMQEILHGNLGPVGRDLRHLADSFASSSERAMVRSKAERVDIQSLTMDQFIQLLEEMFLEGGITRERVLVLLFFCADLTICALRQRGCNFFQQLISWSLKYIFEQLCSWVQDHGGWAVVLKGSMDFLYKAAITAFCVVGVVAAIAYIRKNW